MSKFIDVKTASSTNLALVDYATLTEQEVQTAILQDIEAGTPDALGQQPAAASQPVVIASDQPALDVTGPLTDAELRATAVPVSGPLTDAELRATAVPVSGPLTDAELRATAVPVSGPLTDTELRATAVPVSGPLTDAELRATAVPVSGPLTDAELRATPVDVVQGGRAVVATHRRDYSTDSVTTSAWVELIASLAADVSEIEIFDSSGETLELGTGAGAAETRLIYVTPGGNERVPVSIASGTRISIQAVSGDALVGELVINFYA